MAKISQQHQLLLETLHNKQYTRAGTVRKYQTRNLKQTLLTGMEIYWSKYHPHLMHNVNDPRASVLDTLILQNETDPRIVKFLETRRYHRDQTSQQHSEHMRKLYGPSQAPTAESIIQMIEQTLEEKSNGQA